VQVATAGEGILESVRRQHTRLCVDVGQTGARVLDADGVRHPVARGLSPEQSLEDTISEVLATLDNPQASTVLLSLTGLKGLVPDISELAQQVADTTGCDRLLVADDGLAWSVGALAGADGVSLAVGGGVVAVARHGDRFVHLDGNGADFGDSGGAFWLGREGIRSAIRAIEETGDETTLRESLLREFGTHEEFVRRDMSKDAVHAACVSFAKPVLEAASEGDAVAMDIVMRGADRLAHVVTAAGKQAGLDHSKLLISLGGGAMAAQVYRETLRQRIEELNPGCQIIEPRGDAIDGLCALDEEGPTPDHDLMRWWVA
jgi:glucosamine kinase